MKRMEDCSGSAPIEPIFILSFPLVMFWNIVFRIFKDGLPKNIGTGIMEYILISTLFYLYLALIYDYSGDMVLLASVSGVIHLLILILHFGIIFMIRTRRKSRSL
jgi:hypothetical protein